MARLVVVAPGRGSYNRTELRYLDRFADHPNAARRAELLARADQLRRESGRTPISELDRAAGYSPSQHLPGENASALIFTCAAADYGMLHPNHRIEAVLGNSMGWYSTLFTAGILSFDDAFRVVDSMGNFQKGNILGGQVIYPLVDEEWRPDPEREACVRELVEKIAARGPASWVGISIRLGGSLVLAGTEEGVKALLSELPKLKQGSNEYPFQLARHAAFHTALMADLAAHGFAQLAELDWNQPKLSAIDGTGRIWRRYQSEPEALRNYTFGDQVLKPYDFSKSVRVALREYNPDHIVLLGPGESLGGAIAQVMIQENWRGFKCKSDFMTAQKSERPPLISMNRPEQAALVI